MKRYIFYTVCLLCFLASCRGEKPDLHDPTPGSNDEARAPMGPESELKTGQGEMTPARPLVAGTTTVFGLVLPQKMTPEKSVPKVYRFTGKYPVVHVMGFLRDQLSRSELSREGEGYLLRFGKVRSPKGRSTGEDKLAVRIYRGMKGSVVDIWLEKDYAEKLPPSHGRSADELALVKSRKTTRMSPEAAAVRKKEKQETLRVMRKIAAGGTLDKKDYESPFFD